MFPNTARSLLWPLAFGILDGELQVANEEAEPCKGDKNQSLVHTSAQQCQL